MMKPVKKSFAVPVTKAADVAYRLKRAAAVTEEVAMFVNAIDPSVFPEAHAAMLAAVTHLRDSITFAGLEAPKPKAKGGPIEVVEAVGCDDEA
jgi:hypothetical protein